MRLIVLPFLVAAVVAASVAGSADATKGFDPRTSAFPPADVSFEAASAPSGVTAAGVAPSDNQIVNGDAEAGPGGDGTAVEPVPGWTKFEHKTCGTPIRTTVAQYGSAGGFPTSTSPGPADRGANFFAGGHWTCDWSVLRQNVDLRPHADAIAHGAQFVLGGWFGGFKAQEDTAGVTMCFRDKNGKYISSCKSIGYPTAADRNHKTGLLQDSVEAWIPHGAASAEIWLFDLYATGSDVDAYADDLSFTVLVHTP